MPNSSLIRSVTACAALLSLGGCVAYPVPVPYPEPVQNLAGTTCAAGFYTCPVAPGPVGSQCSCPGIGAPSFGVIR